MLCEQLLPNMEKKSTNGTGGSCLSGVHDGQHSSAREEKKMGWISNSREHTGGGVKKFITIQ